MSGTGSGNRNGNGNGSGIVSGNESASESRKANGAGTEAEGGSRAPLPSDVRGAELRPEVLGRSGASIPPPASPASVGNIATFAVTCHTAPVFKSHGDELRLHLPKSVFFRVCSFSLKAALEFSR